jgi:hypothetical protein
MIKIIAVLTLLISFHAHSECVLEKRFAPEEMASIDFDQYNAFVQLGSKYIPLSKELSTLLPPKSTYWVQLFDKKDEADSGESYNDRYLTYYNYARLLQYLNDVKPSFDGFTLETIGSSVQGRDLFALYPNEIDPNKKTIIMTGRQHGDEGTANWIIEGFLNLYFSKEAQAFRDEFQLILYPMVNPDGAEAQRRYNANNLDLNRSWGLNAKGAQDEIRTIQSHLENKMGINQLTNVVSFLDMHGSFTRDFIYHVDQRTRGMNFFNIQKLFINTLGKHDPWQAGTGLVSNGHPKMARIIMVKQKGINALTHETPRNIELNNQRGRSIQSLKNQGMALIKTIDLLY